jgi:crossover junction endodeoxyribonuclease RusA
MPETGKDEYKFILPMPPSVNSLWRTSGNKVYKSKKYKDWWAHAIWALASQGSAKKITGRYKLSLYFKRPDNRRRDLDNLFKAVSDALQAAGIVTDDCNCSWLEAQWVEEGPECLIKIQCL